ncbi:hypothetical protein HUS23_01875 [Ectothiorhodospiraceae bacterium 2226]|nr:hypothetical protein HUS23_01875 [Ectothiorhodospiraceae bacterium 2226]
MRPLLLLLATLPLVAPADWYTLEEQVDAITLIEGRSQPLAENLMRAHTIGFIYGPETYRGVARPNPERYQLTRTVWHVDCARAHVEIESRTTQERPLGPARPVRSAAPAALAAAVHAHACDGPRGTPWRDPDQARLAKWQALMAATYPWIPAQTPMPAPAE